MLVRLIFCGDWLWWVCGSGGLSGVGGGVVRGYGGGLFFFFFSFFFFLISEGVLKLF